MGGGAGLDGMLFWEGGMIVDLYNIFLYYYFSFIMEIINKQVSVSHLRWDMKITVLVLLLFFCLISCVSVATVLRNSRNFQR